MKIDKFQKKIIPSKCYRQNVFINYYGETFSSDAKKFNFGFSKIYLRKFCGGVSLYNPLLYIFRLYPVF